MRLVLSNRRTIKYYKHILLVVYIYLYTCSRVTHPSLFKCNSSCSPLWTHTHVVLNCHKSVNPSLFSSPCCWANKTAFVYKIRRNNNNDYNFWNDKILREWLIEDRAWYLTSLSVGAADINARHSYAVAWIRAIEQVVQHACAMAAVITKHTPNQTWSTRYR